MKISDSALEFDFADDIELLIFFCEIGALFDIFGFAIFKFGLLEAIGFVDGNKAFFFSSLFSWIEGFSSFIFVKFFFCSFKNSSFSLVIFFALDFA